MFELILRTFPLLFPFFRELAPSLTLVTISKLDSNINHVTFHPAIHLATVLSATHGYVSIIVINGVSYAFEASIYTLPVSSGQLGQASITI